MTWQMIEEPDRQYFELRHRGVRCLYTTRSGADEMIEELRPVFIKQVHGDRIVVWDRAKEEIGDGLITAKKDLTLGVRVADCLPVYIFGDHQVGIIHCGWRGIINGIVRRVKNLISAYHYALGAGIGSCCYEVRDNVIEMYKKDYTRALRFSDGRCFLNLRAAVIQELGAASLVASLDLCTHCHPEYFYSYRRGDRDKRNYALISMVTERS